jgi:hypothetical protein
LFVALFVTGDHSYRKRSTIGIACAGYTWGGLGLQIGWFGATKRVV